MICPHCNTPNHPNAVYCQYCGALLPSPAEVKRQRHAGIATAVTLAILIPLFYYFVMNLVGVVWILKFTAAVPAGISQSEYVTMYTEAFNRDSAYLNIIGAGVCVLFAALFFAARKRSLADAANIRPASSVKLGSAFVCGLTLQIPIGFVLALIPFPEKIVEGHEQLMSACTSPMWVQLLYGVVLAPIIEEIFFRGIVHDRLGKVLPVPLAAALSSAGFALIHGEVLAILVAFACGYLFALLYSRFKTILVPVLFHMGFNLLSYVVSYITDPVLLIASGIASVALFIGSTYLLMRRDDT